MLRKKRLITASILTALLLIRFLLMPQIGSSLVPEHEISMCTMLPTHGNVDTWIGFAELAKGSVPSDK